jgi:hypothetical protein
VTAGDPSYRLTQTGSDLLAAAPPRDTGEVSATAGQSCSDEPVPLESVLDALAEFDQFGGASIQLVAWELDIDETTAALAWSVATADGLIERSGMADRRERMEMWRLTERGWQTRDVAEPTSG